MRSVVLAVALFAMACSAPTKKPVDLKKDLENDQVDGETCCCRWTPIGAENGRASYEETNRMECSQKQGECMAATNCTGPAEPQ